MAGANDAEGSFERKVQLTGGSTYTVSLPKDWARSQGIEPGNTVTLYSHDDWLVVNRGASPDDGHAVTLDATDAGASTIGTRVYSAYVSGATVVRVTGSPDRDHRLAIEDATSGLVGFEIATQSAEEIVVRSMLDASDLSLEQTLLQLNDRCLSMHEAAIGTVVGSASDPSIARQDDAVDRLFALVSRQFHRSLSLVEAATPDRPTAFEFYSAARTLDRVATHAERIAAVASRSETAPPEDIATRLVSLGDRARALVQRSVHGMLDPGDPLSLGRISDDLETVRDDADRLDADLYDTAIPEAYLYGRILDSIVSTAEYGGDIAELSVKSSMRTQTY